MRKPLVVVCAAASALLLAGGVVATSADADERPDMAGFGAFWWPDLFGDDAPGDEADDFADEEPFSDRGPAERPTLEDPAGSDDVDADDPDADADDADDPDTSDPGTDGSDDPGASDDSADADDPGASDGDADTADADDDDRGTPRAATASGQQRRPDAAQRPRIVERPAQQPGFSAQQRPAFTAQRPAQRNAQRSGAAVLAGARRAVTLRDVSVSPSAPVQQRVLVLINQNRRRHGCRPFSLDRRLILAANRHAADMARRRYFAHRSPGGESAGERVSEAGYRWKRYGENIARGADSPYEVVHGWMNSPSHRENILDCRLRQMGIGLAISRDRTPYWVQDFATPDA
ncbi:CAP domain-containing protein [Actinoplanes sp. URMC 104]|uniref:CAP domain-containing protein n=1 Tax=Actinoplanes sp. URMC 104 TaxID=3423409 RepID=UPI003F1A0610